MNTGKICLLAEPDLCDGMAQGTETENDLPEKSRGWEFTVRILVDEYWHKNCILYGEKPLTDGFVTLQRRF